MIRLLALAVLGAVWVQAAVVQGTIFDEETKNPIARAHVALVALPGTVGGTTDLLANERGQYAFLNVRPGFYLLRATRIGFEATEYGAVRAGLPGKPVEITATSNDDELRQIVMRRQASITGTVVDDNSVGIVGWTVNLYSGRPPVRRLGQTMTDDRGNFRFGELEAGTYLVRSGGGGLEDASTLVPAYYKYGTTVAGAEPVRVRLGETQGFIVIHTVEGKLFELTGEVTTPDARPVHLTLITDTGRRTLSSGAGPFAASGVSPGQVELLAEGAGCAGRQMLLVDRNMFARIDCTPLTAPMVSGAAGVQLLARRVNLDGPGAVVPLAPGQTLSPGLWEFSAPTDPAYYLASVQLQGSDAPPPVPSDGWFELPIGNAPSLRATLSTRPATVTGTVTSASQVVTGAPVFLALLNPEVPERSLQTWNVRADAHGSFSFAGLPPGMYRLMSSFDFDFDDPIARDRAVSFVVKEGESVSRPLEMLRP